MINIPGIDIPKALESFNGNEENYLKVLRSFLAGTKTKLEILENIDINNLKNYEIAIHGVKGTANSIFAESIGIEAKALENAAVAGNIEFINQNNPALIEKLKDLLNFLENMFDTMDSSLDKQQKEKPDTATLKKLLEACDIYDMMEVEAAMNEINSFYYTEDDGLVKWLKQKAEEMNYEAIVEKLNILLNAG